MLCCDCAVTDWSLQSDAVPDSCLFLRDEELRDACEAQAAVGDCGNPSPIFDVVRTTCRDTCGVCADPEFDRTPCYALPGDVILAIDVAGAAASTFFPIYVF